MKHLTFILFTFAIQSAFAERLLQCRYNTETSLFLGFASSTPVLSIYALDDNQVYVKKETLEFDSYKERNEAKKYCLENETSYDCQSAWEGHEQYFKLINNRANSYYEPIFFPDTFAECTEDAASELKKAIEEFIK